MTSSTIAPTAFIDPLANLNETTIVGPEAQIGAQVVTGLRVRIGAGTRILGPVTIGYGVLIGRRCTLSGPLQIAQEVVIEDGAVLGAVAAAGSLLEQGEICDGARVGAGAEVLGLLSIGEYARLQPGARLEGNLPHRALASGKPAALDSFVCSCGQEYISVGQLGPIYLMRCPSCRGEFRLKMSALQRRGRYLLPNQQAGDEVPLWRQAE